METDNEKPRRSSVRTRADAIKAFRCKNLIAVIENPVDVINIGTVIRNVNALGVEKTYIVDPERRKHASQYRLRKKRGKRETPLPTVMPRDE